MFSRDGARRGPQGVPVLPLRDLVVFPGMTVPLIVGRPGSRGAVEQAWEADRTLVVVTQRGQAVTEGPPELHEVGTQGRLLQLVTLPDGNLKVLVEGIERVRIERTITEGEVLSAEVEALADSGPVEAPADVLKSLREAFEAYARLNKGIPPEMVLRVESMDNVAELADTLAAHLLGFKLEDRQALLEESDPLRRLDRVLRYLRGEVEILQVERKIKSRVQRQMERSQKEHYLNEQMQAIQKELGEKDEFKAEFAELQERFRNHPMPEAARARGERELRKLRMMSPMSAEATVVRNYIDWLLSLPWDKVTEERRELAHASQVLDEDHYGLDKVKERILEQLAVGVLVDKPRGPILCLVGPPGVGKTSLGRSIARATQRPFVRQALGGERRKHDGEGDGVGGLHGTSGPNEPTAWPMKDRARTARILCKPARREERSQPTSRASSPIASSARSMARSTASGVAGSIRRGGRSSSWKAEMALRRAPTTDKPRLKGGSPTALLPRTTLGLLLLGSRAMRRSSGTSPEVGIL